VSENDKITITRNGLHKLTSKREQIVKVTVVSKGFTCEMTAEQFFKIIHEAFKW